MIEPKFHLNGIQWDDFRNADKSISLIPVYEWTYDQKASDNVKRYLKAIHNLKPIKSRQVAATIIVNARAFDLIMTMPPNPEPPI